MTKSDAREKALLELALRLGRATAVDLIAQRWAILGPWKTLRQAERIAEQKLKLFADDGLLKRTAASEIYRITETGKKRLGELSGAAPKKAEVVECEVTVERDGSTFALYGFASTQITASTRLPIGKYRARLERIS